MTEYRIDELAQRAGTTVRNVRAYQERGLLSPPRRQGRAGVFDDDHLRRLRMIGRLLERGYTLANIGELLDAWEKGRAIHDVIGEDERIPARVTLPWLVAAFRPGSGGRHAPQGSTGTGSPPDAPTGGGAAPAETKGADRAGPAPAVPSGDDVAALQAAFDLGVLDPVADEEGFRVTNPRLLAAAIELARAGIPMAAIAQHAHGLRQDVDSLARRVVDLVDDHLFVPLGDELPTPEEAARLSDLAQRLRPLADEVVLGELDRAIDELVQQRLHDRLARLLGR